MKVCFASEAPAAPAALVLGVNQGGTLPAATAAADAKLGGVIARAVAGSRFTGKEATSLDLVLDHGGAPQPVVLVGLGAAGALEPARWRRAGGGAATALGRLGHGRAGLAFDGKGLDLAHLAQGALLGAYRFDRYRTKARDEDPRPIEELTVVTANKLSAERAFAALETAAAGVGFARDLVSEPANVLNPETFAARAGAVLTPLGVDVEALPQARLEAMGMGALLAVARGSANAPCVLVMRWNGADDAGAAPLAFVGKGLTFDSGGISIKPAKGMEEMKGDMAGGAAVAGLLRALAGRKARINAVGVVGLVENMPSARSYRPGDVVKTMAGETIEIINTDAEGRLVLADALHYTATTFKPAAIIDLATLTGSIVAGLGRVYAGLFATDERLATDLLAASRLEDEKLWRMPLDQGYADNLDSPIADVRQFAPDEERADAPHAAQFLSRFVAGVPWAHLDIAGVEFFTKDTALGPKGASGFGVRLLDRFAAVRGRRGARRGR
ncbi:MAG: leucyl aminopeptidase [Alphaproteobacteria bacterium]